MRIKDQKPSAKILSMWIANAMANKRAEAIRIIDMRKISNSLMDYMVLGSGNNARQVLTLCEEVITYVRTQCRVKPTYTEGLTGGMWGVIDYIDVVAHIFDTKTRNYYALESLWGDVPISCPYDN